MKMWLALALALLVAPSLAGAMTIQDVKRLSQGGAGDDVIMSQIEASNEVFTLTVQDILDLKEAGASDRVITFMINSGKQRTADTIQAGPSADAAPGSAEPGSDDPGAIAGIDTRRYERLPGDDDSDAAEEDLSSLNDRYTVGVAAGYDWSPYWNISLGWGYGGYYDPWYCGYWPTYWDYYSPFRCWSAYWWCPPRYDRWWNYGYPVYYGGNWHDGGHNGRRSDRAIKDGRSVYGRGGQTTPGVDHAAGYGRGYKGQPNQGQPNQGQPPSGTPAPERRVDRNRQVNHGWRSGQSPSIAPRPTQPPVGTTNPTALRPARQVKRDQRYRIPEVTPPVAPVPPAPGTPSTPPPPPPSYGGRGSRGTLAPNRGAPPAVAPAPARAPSKPSRPPETGRTTKKN